MDDNLTLADYNIQHESTLELQEKMQIYVREIVNWRTTITLEVDSSDTIDSIKDRIERTEGFSKDQQCIVFHDEQLEGERTLADHNICKDSTLLLVLHPSPRGKIQIFVKMLDGATATFHVERSYTINDVKMMIYKRGCIRPIQQRLLFTSEYLDGRRTLESYNIVKESTLHLILCLCGC
jgi:ubiquitin C